MLTRVRRVPIDTDHPLPRPPPRVQAGSSPLFAALCGVWIHAPGDRPRRGNLPRSACAGGSPTLADRLAHWHWRDLVCPFLFWRRVPTPTKIDNYARHFSMCLEFNLELWTNFAGTALKRPRLSTSFRNGCRSALCSMAMVTTVSTWKDCRRRW